MILSYKEHRVKTSSLSTSTPTEVVPPTVKGDGLCLTSLGNNVWLKVSEWKGEKRVDIREYNTKYPTKTGISLTLNRWTGLCHAVDMVDEHLTRVKKGEHVEFEFHIGGNVYVSINSPFWIVSIRQFFCPMNGANMRRPTPKGIRLKLGGWNTLKETIASVQREVPELENFVPCFARNDHSNQMGFLTCPECNPEGYQDYE